MLLRLFFFICKSVWETSQRKRREKDHGRNGTARRSPNRPTSSAGWRSLKITCTAHHPNGGGGTAAPPQGSRQKGKATPTHGERGSAPPLMRGDGERSTILFPPLWVVLPFPSYFEVVLLSLILLLLWGRAAFRFSPCGWCCFLPSTS